MPACREDSMEGETRRYYRRRMASMVPVATMTPSTPTASKSVRISFMVVIPSYEG